MLEHVDHNLPSLVLAIISTACSGVSASTNILPDHWTMNCLTLFASYPASIAQLTIGYQ